MKRPLVVLVLMAGLFALQGTAPASSLLGSPESESMLGAALVDTAGLAAPGPRLENFTLVAHLDTLGLRDYGDVWANGDIAYLATRCGTRPHGGHGVQVIDISDPASPVVASTLSNPRYTRSEDVVVQDISTPSFQGSLAVIGIQSCFGTGYENRVRTGLIAYDVTDPYAPVHLSQWTLGGFAAGCHEIDLVQRPDGVVLAGCAQNLLDQLHGQTALTLVDLTDPTAPTVAGTFSLPIDEDSGVGCIPFSWAHSVRFADQGETALVSYWDNGGTVNLDISDPAAPTVVGTTHLLPLDEDGDNHSAITARGGDLLVVNPEDFCPDTEGQVGYGEAYVFDNSDPANTTLLGTFFTENTHQATKPGVYTVHNTEVWSEQAESYTQFMSSWYSDGIVWWQMSQDGTSTQLGHFVPDRSGGIPFVWGVYPIPDRNLVLASDLGSGLWIVSPS